MLSFETGNRFGGCFEFEVLQQLVTKNTVQAKLVYKDPADVKTLKSSATQLLLFERNSHSPRPGFLILFSNTFLRIVVLLAKSTPLERGVDPSIFHDSSR